MFRNTRENSSEEVMQPIKEATEEYTFSDEDEDSEIYIKYLDKKEQELQEFLKIEMEMEMEMQEKIQPELELPEELPEELLEELPEVPEELPEVPEELPELEPEYINLNYYDSDDENIMRHQNIFGMRTEH